MKNLVVWFKGLSIRKKIASGLAGVLVLVIVFGLASLGKFPEKPSPLKSGQPSRLERSESVKKSTDLDSRRELSENKRRESSQEQPQSPEAKDSSPSPTESQTPSENVSKAEQLPAQSQTQTTGEPKLPSQTAQSETQSQTQTQAQLTPSQQSTPSTAPQPPSSPAAEGDEEDPPAPTEAKFVGSIKALVYHTLDCPLAKKISQDDKILFSSSDEALDLEYNPCTSCNPPH